MRVSKILIVGFVASVLGVGLLATNPASADDADASLMKLTCSNGEVTVTPNAPWHANPKAPWRWDKGAKVAVTEKDGAHFKGTEGCKGTVTAFICDGHDGQGSCKGPISVTVH